MHGTQTLPQCAWAAPLASESGARHQEQVALLALLSTPALLSVYELRLFITMSALQSKFFKDVVCSDSETYFISTVACLCPISVSEVYRGLPSRPCGVASGVKDCVCLFEAGQRGVC